MHYFYGYEPKIQFFTIIPIPRILPGSFFCLGEFSGKRNLEGYFRINRAFVISAADPCPVAETAETPLNFQTGSNLNYDLPHS